MKKLLIATILLTIIGLFITGCTDPPVIAPTISTRIIGKWTMKTAIGNYTTLGTNYKDTTTFSANDYFEFKVGGDVTIVESGTTYNGTWKVTNDKLYFSGTNYIDNASGFSVSVLTANTLQLYHSEVNSVATVEQTLNLTK